MKGSEFLVDYFHSLYYKCHKINSNRGGSYIDSPNWVRNKRATVNVTITKIRNAFNML